MDPNDGPATEALLTDHRLTAPGLEHLYDPRRRRRSLTLEAVVGSPTFLDGCSAPDSGHRRRHKATQPANAFPIVTVSSAICCGGPQPPQSRYLSPLLADLQTKAGRYNYRRMIRGRVLGTCKAFELQMQHNDFMKTGTNAPVRVAPDLRAEVEGVLAQGESLSQFVESALRQTVLKRQHQAEFLRQGIAAIDEAKRENSGVSADVVVGALKAKLVAARRNRPRRD